MKKKVKESRIVITSVKNRTDRKFREDFLSNRIREKVCKQSKAVVEFVFSSRSRRGSRNQTNREDEERHVSVGRWKIRGLKCRIDRPQEEASDGGRLRQNRKRVTPRRGCCCSSAGDPPLGWDEQTRRPKELCEVERNSLSDQIALLEEMLHKGTSLTSGGENRTQSELRASKEDVKAIKVPFVDWEKLGEGWFWSQPWRPSPNKI
ncbi:hypothetical protein Bca52824_034463 [Brassica carinata]|uniref:Uncharacterized protein n=1 Tax=Brassica carinata TaxID=52824 RepID=A0A8X7V1S8_BRACI|nr:hypothetical protein Bca52824_034463 [Brassica carinata]